MKKIGYCLEKVGLLVLGMMIFLGSSSVVLAMQEGSTRMEKKDARMDGVMKRVDVSGMPKDANQEAKMERLKQKAIKEIERRVESLNKLITKVNVIKKLSAEQKAIFVSGIQAEIDALSSLKAKIEGGTDLQTLRADVQSVMSSHRIYALYIPQIHILVTADVLSNSIERFTAFAEKLQVRIDEAKIAGNDVTSLQLSLDDMKKEIAEAQQEVQNVINTVVGLIPSGYPGNKMSLQSARTMLQSGRENLRSAHEDARVVMKGLKEMGLKPSGMEMSPMRGGSGIGPSGAEMGR